MKKQLFTLKLLTLLLTCLLWNQVHAQTQFKSLNYLNSISGSKTIAGQQAKQYWETMKNVSGKYPGMWGEDFSFYNFGGTSSMSEWRTSLTNEAKQRWAEGAIINFTFHACPPTMGEPCSWGNVTGRLSDAQWNELITNGTALNNAWKARLDVISTYMQELKNSGVEVLFRPFHEMNHPNVFWWAGRPGANGSRRLYQITRDYMVNVKGLTNIIWVWNLQDFNSLSSDINNYDPGSAYYDVISLDNYNSDGQGYSSTKYNIIANKAGSKPIGIGECGTLPTSSQLSAQPRWTHFVAWAELTQQQNTNAVISNLYNAGNVITMDEMPGWNTVVVPDNLATNKSVTVSSTEAGANIGSSAVDNSYSTRWSSQYSDPQWIYVDLGANYNVNRVKITWEAAFATAYQIQVSSDASTWTTIKTVSGNTSLTNDQTGISGTGRYVRIYGTARATVYGFSIFALEIYGSIAGDTQAPTVPGNLQNTAMTTSSLSFAWNASTDNIGVVGYDVYKNGIYDGSATGTSYTANGLTAATSYVFTVKAKDAANNYSSASNSLTVTTSSNGGSNVSLGKPITVSSTESGANVGSFAVDGNVGTRWSSLYSDPQWIVVDLGANYNVNRVKITWEAAYATAYQIQVSADASSWSTVQSVSGNSALVNDHAGLNGTGRYIRMYGTARGTVYGYSIFELEVYGTLIPVSVNLAYNRPVTVSSAEAAGYEGSKAVDANGTTRWASLFTDPQWIYVDLGATYNVNRVKIAWEAAYGKNYYLEGSTNASTWMNIKTVTNNTVLVNDHTGLSANARYIRMYGTARGTAWGYSIFELEVYGTAAGARIGLEEKESEGAEQISAYPVPMESQLTVQFSKGRYREMTVIDIAGRVSIQKMILAGENELNLNVGHLPKGVYLLILKDYNGNFVKRKLLK